MIITGLKIDKKESGNIDSLLLGEFKSTNILYELKNGSYYLYLKDTINKKQLERHELIYLKNSLKRVRSDFLYNLYPSSGAIQQYRI